MGERSRTVSLGLRGLQPARRWTPGCRRRDRDRVLRLLPSLSGYPCAVMRYTPATGPRPVETSLRQIIRSIFYASPPARGWP